MPMSTFLPAITQLCRLLYQEETTCQQLLETVHTERAAIRTLAITEFHSINCRRLSILESLQSLADERQQLVQELAVHYGLQPVTTSIQELIDNIQDSASENLRTAYRSYMTVAKTVRDEIKQNVVLIEGIRGVVDQALSSRRTCRLRRRSVYRRWTIVRRRPGQHAHSSAGIIMIGLTSLFDIARSALTTSQQALAVTGHNVANVNTPGYSRQEAVLTERPPLNGQPGMVGTGVQATSIRRYTDQFINRQLTTVQQNLEGCRCRKKSCPACKIYSETATIKASPHA